MDILDTSGLNMKIFIVSLLFFCLNTILFAGSTSIGSVTDNGSGGYNITSAGERTSHVEAFLSTTPNISINNDAFWGSALKNSLEIEQGDIFSFNWIWSSTESDNSTNNDFAFVSLILDDTLIFNDIDVFASVYDYGQNEIGIYSWEAIEDGTLYYGIGVMDASSYTSQSAITVSNIKVDVPLPATIWLFILGLSGLFTMRKINYKPTQISIAS